VAGHEGFAYDGYRGTADEDLSRGGVQLSLLVEASMEPHANNHRSAAAGGSSHRVTPHPERYTLHPALCTL